MTGLRDSKPVLAQDDHWNCDTFGLANVLDG
jgi:hypothetical protein